MLLGQHAFDRFDLGLFEQAHLLADELHLAALAFKVGDALGLNHGVFELLAQVQPRHEIRAQREQIFTQFLQRQAFLFLVGAAHGICAFELYFQLKVKLAALGDEFAFDEVAFGGFA